MMQVRALLFDTDDTLWQATQPLTAERVEAIAAAQLSVLLDRWGETGVDAARLAHTIAGSMRAAMRAASASLLSSNYSEVLDGAARACGLELDAERLDALWRAWYVEPQRLGRQVYPDAASTLSWARAARYRLALVANGPFDRRFIDDELRAAGLRELFDGVALSCECGWLKPHPHLFLDALRQLGVEPDAAVMVGDSLAEDVKGAMLLGMKAVWKRNGRRPQPGERPAVTPTYQIDDLWELRAIPALRREVDGAALPPGALLPSEGPDATGQWQRPDRYA